MSDAQRPPSPSNGNAGDESPDASGRASRTPPARDMADIARLFLDGARPSPPARTGPKQRQAAPQTPPPQPVLPRVSPKSTADVVTPAAREVATLMLGLAAGSTALSNWNLLLHAAAGLSSEQEIAVALVGVNHSSVQGSTFAIDVVGFEDQADLPAPPSADPTAPDMHIARTLHRLRPVIGLWIVAAPDPDSAAFAAMAGVVPHWLLASATDNEGLVGGYQYLKRAWPKASTKVTPSVFLLSDDYAQAALVHKRLRKAAQEFLKTDLRFAGAGPIAPAPSKARQRPTNPAEAIRVLTLSAPREIEPIWAAVLDELCPLPPADEEPTAANPLEEALEHVADRAAHVARSANASFAVLDHLANVLDPEERAALAMDFPEPGVPVAQAGFRNDVSEEVAVPPVPAKTVAMFTEPPAPTPTFAPAAPSAAAARAQSARETRIESAAIPPSARTTESMTPTLRAFDLEPDCGRAAQWQAVERSIWDLLPKSVLLEAKPPMSWAADTCIAIDQKGHLHVWTLYRDGASWFALREWASEHRNLLALTRRDLTVDKQAEVAVHIVLPLQDETTSSQPTAAPATPGHPAGENPVAMLMRTPSRNIHLYRLRIVQWHARCGMVVVPLM